MTVADGGVQTLKVMTATCVVAVPHAVSLMPTAGVVDKLHSELTAEKLRVQGQIKPEILPISR